MVQLKLELVFWGSLLDPVEFTNRIGFASTNYWFKGDSILNNKTYRHETAWEYSTGFIKTYYLEDVSKLLLDKFDDKLEVIREYLNLNKIETKLYIVAESSDGDTPALYFDKRLIKFLSKIDGVVDIDLYVL